MAKRKLKRQFKISLFILIIGGILALTLPAYVKREKLDNYNNEKTTIHVEDKEDKHIRKAKLTLVGDFLFESPFYKAVDKGYDKNQYFSLVKNYFIDDDLSIGNMEVVIGSEDMKVSGDGYNFCAPPYIGELVNTLDLEVLATANNHSYDQKLEGINSTLDFFAKTDIMTVGTYRDKTDRDTMRILNVNDIKFGFLSYTLGTNVVVPADKRDLVGLYRSPETRKFDEEYKSILTREVMKLRDACDVLIVMMHWGNEFTYTPNEEQKEIATFLNSLGVDIIYGSHSHSIQPISEIGDAHKTLVYYSLGNFVSHDDDIARTPKGYETFDNAYQFGLLSTLDVVIDEFNELTINNVKAIPIVNYFDKDMNNFLLVPFSQYTDQQETSHLRYQLGLTKAFINDAYNKVIDKKYH